MTVKVELSEANPERIRLWADYTHKDLIKQIPGARFNAPSRYWHVPLSWAACKQLRAVFGPELEIGPELLAWAEEEVTSRILPTQQLRLATDASAEGLDSRLLPFQRAGVLFQAAAGRCILGDPVGAGKTVQTICAARLLNALPALVVCPSSMQIAWKREIEKWWPNIPVYIVDGTATARKKQLDAAKDQACVLIMKWEVVRLHSRLSGYGSMALSDTEKTPKELNSIPFALVIADEAHRMKDAKSKQTRGMWAASSTATYRFALTGTPLTDAPDTLWPVLHFLSPTEWPSKTAFIERYCLKAFNGWGGIEVFGIRPEMEREFFEVFDTRFRRMPKEVVLPQLPPVVRQRRYLDMGREQTSQYNAMADSMLAGDENGNLVIASNPIAQLTRLVQFSSATAAISDEGEVRLKDPSNKLDALMGDLDDFISDGEGVVVFAQSRQLIEMAEARLTKAKIPHSVIKGQQTTDERQRMIDDFQEGRTAVILVVIAAGGVGITLTRGRVGIFLQRTFSQVDMEQAHGRIHRIGSERHSSITIVDYISKGTVEEQQLDILESKSQRLEEIVRDRAAIRKLLGR